MASQSPAKDKLKVFLICDSRGRELQEYFTECDYNITVKFYSGAKLYRSTKLAENEIKRQQPDHIYILAGINSITKLNKRTREVTLIADDKNKIAQQYKDEMNFALASLRKICKNDTKIIFAPITGMDLSRYNKVDASALSESQNVLDETVIEINNIIIAQNATHNYKTPWTHGIIHRYFRGKYHFMYDKLDEDGCHLTDLIRSFWGRKIISAIAANCLVD